ncbi:hypothetical protein H5410_064572 [Solanum commersonii]|uniref:Uncharacterized protein n=1 Tax=Solanum commersonii TaxID=4109 RepID=A0A9J5VZ08_SOLCO|nr:hypothetical protein H5410_064572 [Solanum commersonii]
MENLKNDCHVLLVTFPGQGHINPSLQFAKKIVNLGIKVTFSTSLTAFNRISKLPNIEGLSFTPFSDGYDGKFKGSLDEFEVVEGRPFKRVIYTTLMAWVGIVAKGINIPSTFFLIQPATVLDIYYYCFTDYADCFKNCSQDQVVDLPGLPRLSPCDFPSFVFTNVNSKYGWGVKSIIDQIELLNSEENPRVLVNTFDDLEFDALRALKNLTMVGIGPSIPSSFLDGNDPLDKSFGADLRWSSENYMDWLDTMTKESVIYITFDSYSDISSQLMEEIGQGLVKCGRPFLWVIREEKEGGYPEEKLTCKEELEKQGKIVRWCSQVEVLQHPSLGCFLTHCGWNSTLESLSSGMPIVACPLWTDQGCNAKLIQDVWKIGVRVNASEEGVVERDEFKRCIDIVMEDGEKREELKKNAKKWKDLAKEAMKENGSSNVNLKAYVNEILIKNSLFSLPKNENLKNEKSHVLIVIFPGQVTLSTSLSAFNKIKILPNIEGLSFAPFSDGYDGNFKGSFNEFHSYYSSIKSHGSKFNFSLIKSNARNNTPFTHYLHCYYGMGWFSSKEIKYSIYIILDSTSHDYSDYFKNCDSKDKIIELPGLPPLSPIDFPSFVFDDVEGNNWAAESIKRQIDILNSKENPKILVNTFDDLEFDALRILKNVTMIEIGPSIPSIFLDDNSFQADMIEISSRNYMNWLDIMTKGSVIYVAFGSYTEASSQLMEEIGQGLLKCERPFLWVTREGQIEEKLTCKDELEKQGKLVKSIASECPSWHVQFGSDQLCNAKLVQDVWKNDVKVNTGDGGIVERDEFERCIEIVMGNGEEGGKLRKNAKKWSDLAKEAMKKNGSSTMNVKTYANEFYLLNGVLSSRE